MKTLMSSVFVIHGATGDATGHRLRGVIVAQPLHIPPGSFSPDEVVDPEQRLDKKGSPGYGSFFQHPDCQGMPPGRTFVVGTCGYADHTVRPPAATCQPVFIAAFHVDGPFFDAIDNHLISETDAVGGAVAGTFQA